MKGKELSIGGGYYSNYHNELCTLVSQNKIENEIMSAGPKERQRYYWSDLFFNFDDQNWHPKITAREFKQTAKRFKEQWPGCPFSVKWLMEDFLRRV